VFGAGDDFAGIDTARHALQTELEERRRQRARGVRRFAPVRVIMSEAADLMANCAHARPVFAGILRRGAKLGISLVVDVQDRQRKTLDLDGQTHLLNNFDTQVDVRRQADHRRIAIVKRGEEALEYPIPQLPDLDQLQASTSLLEAPDRQTDRQTDLIATPETIDAVPSVCPGDRNAVIAVLLQNDWSTSQIRTVIKGDNNELSATIKRLKGDADAH
jgi:hypothetical protein